MTLRTFEWRTIALPTGVVVTAVVVLLWFQVVRVPTVERYLDEAHLRVLRTVASQIKSRIDQIDEHLDLATRSVAAAELGGKDFIRLVKNYTGDLEVLCAGPSAAACDSPLEQTLWAAARERAVGQLFRKGGRDFLYMAYPRADGLRIVARIDVAKVFADNLPGEREFDAVLLADGDGRVIVQHSAEGLDLARVDWLKAGAPASPPPGSAEPSPAAVGWRGVGRSTTVVVAGTTYNFYAHPVPLSLQSLRPGSYAPGDPEEWTLAGFVASDRIRAESAAVPYDVLAWLAIALLAISAAIPLLKLYLLNPHERLARQDALWVAASIVTLVSLSTVLIFQLYEFEFAVPRRLDRRLQAISRRLIAQFDSEAQRIGDQLVAFHRELRHHPVPVDETDGGVPKIIPSRDGCKPAWSCRQAVLREKGPQIAAMAYPFFDLATWLDLNGQQRVKWSTAAGVTPFINSAAQRLQYFESLRNAKLIGESAPQSGMSVVLSPTTGKRLTVFWRAVPEDDRQDEIGQLAGQTLVVNPVTFDQPVLPSGVGFAVVDRAGRVLFHSDRSRSMKENFVQESDGDLALRSHVEQRTRGLVTVNYRARTQRVFVTPLELAGAGIAASPRPGMPRPPDTVAAERTIFPSPDWSLLVFQDRTVSDTLMLYTLAVTAGLFALYAIALLLACAAAWLCLRRRVLAWLWPDRRQTTAYLWLAGGNAAIVGACVWAVYRLPVPQLLLLTAAGVAAALAATVAVAIRPFAGRRSPADGGVEDRRSPAAAAAGASPAWLGAFLAARASLVFIVAVIPVLAAMQTAISLEQRIFVAHDAQRLVRDSAARTARLQERLSPGVICGPSQSCPGYRAFLATLAELEPSSPPLAPLFRRQAEADERTPFWRTRAVRRFLWFVHPPVNDLGVELLPMVLGAVPHQAGPSPWWLAALPPLLLLSWLLVAYATERMCQPDVVVGEIADGLDSAFVMLAAPDAMRSHRLIVSPPGRALPDAWNRAPVSLDLRLRPLPRALPPGDLVIIRHLEAGLVDPRARRQVLALLEMAVCDPDRTLWVSSDRDPVAYVEALDSPLPSTRASAGKRVEVDRWILLLQAFRCEVAGVSAAAARPAVAAAGLPVVDVGETRGAPVPDAIAAEVVRCPALLPLIREVGHRLTAPVPVDAWWDRLEDAAVPYYRSLWSSCSREEQLVLRQLAEEGLVNPRDRGVLMTLIRKGLVTRDPAFRLMNVSFARYVTRAVPDKTIAQWEHQIAGTPWSSVRTALITMTMVGAGFVLMTQQHLLSAWVGLLPALAPTIVVPMLREAAGKLLAQRFSNQTHA